MVLKQDVIDEIHKQIGEQMSKFVGKSNTNETIESILKDVNGALKSQLTEGMKLKTRMYVCINSINSKHRFMVTGVEGEDYTEPFRINGKPLCEQCEKMFRLQYEVAGIDEYSTFEDYVESQLVIDELTRDE